MFLKCSAWPDGEALNHTGGDCAGIDRDRLTVHADNGSSMAAKPMAFLLADLGVHQDPFPATFTWPLRAVADDHPRHAPGSLISRAGTVHLFLRISREVSCYSGWA